MFYKPNYCCNCGEKIERIEWNLFTSRRFCGVCESEHQLDDWLKKIFPTVFLLIGIFGIGSYFQGAESTVDVTKNDKEAVLQNTAKEQNTKPRVLKSSNDETIRTINRASIGRENVSKDQKETKAKPVTLEKNRQPDKTDQVVVSRSPQKDVNGTVYFCGAETKKGTPCSRKVKGGGRCWQHEGREALLSDKDLLIERE